jgi:hypothetical protein
MIKNERELQITKAQADKFAEAINNLRSRQNGDPLLMQLESDALERQLDELRNQLKNSDLIQTSSSRCD